MTFHLILQYFSLYDISLINYPFLSKFVYEWIFLCNPVAFDLSIIFLLIISPFWILRLVLPWISWLHIIGSVCQWPVWRVRLLAFPLFPIRCSYNFVPIWFCWILQSNQSVNVEHGTGSNKFVSSKFSWSYIVIYRDVHRCLRNHRLLNVVTLACDIRKIPKE